MEVAGVTLGDCVREFNISVELLDKEVSDEHTWEISKFLQWRRVAPYLKLDDSEVARQWIWIHMEEVSQRNG